MDLGYVPKIHTVDSASCLVSSQPTACVTCVWAGVDSVWEQEKLEARKMPVNRVESHTSGARCVRRRHLDAASSFLRSPLPYTLIMTVELYQVPFGIEKVKHPTM